MGEGPPKRPKNPYESGPGGREDRPEWQPCGTCRGGGVHQGKTCPTCNGTGKIRTAYR